MREWGAGQGAAGEGDPPGRAVRGAGCGASCVERGVPPRGPPTSDVKTKRRGRAPARRGRNRGADSSGQGVRAPHLLEGAFTPDRQSRGSPSVAQRKPWRRPHKPARICFRVQGLHQGPRLLRGQQADPPWSVRRGKSRTEQSQECVSSAGLLRAFTTRIPARTLQGRSAGRGSLKGGARGGAHWWTGRAGHRLLLSRPGALLWAAPWAERAGLSLPSGAARAPGSTEPPPEEDGHHAGMAVTAGPWGREPTLVAAGRRKVRGQRL